jgi:NAD(P)-dependent dehydrogenase (short-subunit alcohol dehydrogenase family)
VAALELAPEVRVNAVLPGAVQTAMFEAGLERFADDDASRRAAVDRLVSRTPLARVGEPEEIATVIAFLLDNEQSSFVTGTTLVADGGVTARLASE